jgi:hypothetical protein
MVGKFLGYQPLQAPSSSTASLEDHAARLINQLGGVLG